MICLNCGRKLKNVTSRKAGYGPVCYKKVFGFNMQNNHKNTVSEKMNSSCYDIPGQMTLKEYLQTASK